MIFGRLVADALPGTRHRQHGGRSQPVADSLQSVLNE